MQRPQPTQPERAELVVPRRELVRQPLAVARAQRRAHAAAVRRRRSPTLKHESQRRVRVGLVAGEVGRVLACWCRSRSGRPGCSWRSRGSGRATSSQRGCSRFAMSRSRMPAVSSVRPICARRGLDHARPPRRRPRRRPGATATRAEHAPRRASLPTSTTKRWSGVEELGERRGRSPTARAGRSPSTRRSRCPPAIRSARRGRTCRRAAPRSRRPRTGRRERTRSCTPIAASSHARAPTSASFRSRPARLPRRPAAVAAADLSPAGRGAGRSSRLGDWGGRRVPEAARRRRERAAGNVPAPARRPRRAGRSATPAMRSSTMAPSRTVGPTSS